MIEPPSLHTEERQEYDIMDLEILGKIAVELAVHSHPAVKRSFERLVEAVGTKRFSEDYCALQKFLMKLHQQVQVTSELSYIYSTTQPSSTLHNALGMGGQNAIAWTPRPTAASITPSSSYSRPAGGLVHAKPHISEDASSNEAKGGLGGSIIIANTNNTNTASGALSAKAGEAPKSRPNTAGGGPSKSPTTGTGKGANGPPVSSGSGLAMTPSGLVGASKSSLRRWRSVSSVPNSSSPYQRKAGAITIPNGNAASSHDGFNFWATKAAVGVGVGVGVPKPRSNSMKIVPESKSSI